MVIKYKFLDNTTSEVEVDNELGKHITEMDEADYNLNRKETRRHDYISELEENGHYIPDDSGPLDDVLKAVWNKNMVCRVLENKKYIGENGYPQIVTAKPVMKRKSNTTPTKSIRTPNGRWREFLRTRALRERKQKNAPNSSK